MTIEIPPEQILTLLYYPMKLNFLLSLARFLLLLFLNLHYYFSWTLDIGLVRLKERFNPSPLHIAIGEDLSWPTGLDDEEMGGGWEGAADGWMRKGMDGRLELTKTER